VKTTLEIPDRVFRRAKARAAEQGIPLRQFVTQAVEEKLKASAPDAERPWMKAVGGLRHRPWMKAVGGLRHLRHETARINKLIEEEFEKIEPEDRA
jgi:hypothetical protein